MYPSGEINGSRRIDPISCKNGRTVRGRKGSPIWASAQSSAKRFIGVLAAFTAFSVAGRWLVGTEFAAKNDVVTREEFGKVERSLERIENYLFYGVRPDMKSQQ